MQKYPSIEQFRSVVRKVIYNAQHVETKEDGEIIIDPAAELPILNFQGTVKLHGTNAAIVFQPSGEVKFQSRNNLITPEKDNMGFARYMIEEVGVEKLKDLEKTLQKELLSCNINIAEEETLIVYGEWCGGNIQKGIAISELDKRFIIFSLKKISSLKDEEGYFIHPKYWGHIDLSEYSNSRIFNIYTFETISMNIDFNNPGEHQNILGEITQRVEKECPVGKYFGIRGIGEGVVWTCTDPSYETSPLMFKVKGEKHSSSKVKVLAKLDVEKLNSIKEFIEYSLTENRLHQGVEYLREQNLDLNINSTGKFISWVFADIMKEEKDTLEASGLTKKDVGKDIGKIARKWFFKKLKEL